MYIKQVAQFGLVALAIGSMIACSASVLVSDPDPARYENQIKEFASWDASNVLPINPVVFVGSSSIRRWNINRDFSGLPKLNRGFGGSQISDINYFIDETVLKYEPKVVVFYAGENDIVGRKSSDRVFEDYKQFVESVMSQIASVDIVFVSIKPTPDRWGFWPQMEETNKKIHDFSNAHTSLHYVDVASDMLDQNGAIQDSLYVGDGIHMTDEGYEIWVSLVRDLLNDIY